ncbi:hypothetical protein EU523_01925 [Candidatus Heimdallarchaeota archaeon]|nr:MAG: hypothetical protein EU523_01925 [Candidatus Heimdallarchaeota archaeon]
MEGIEFSFLRSRQSADYHNYKRDKREYILDSMKRDSSFSVFENYQSPNDVDFIVPMIFELFIVITTITIGLILFILDPQFNLAKIILFVTAALILTPLTPYVIYKSSKYRRIKNYQKLMDNTKIKRLVELATNNESFVEYTDKFYAILILIDLKYKKLVSILKSELDKTDHPGKIEKLKWALNLLALKLEYEDMFDLLNISKDNMNHSEKMIPISEVYFLEKELSVDYSCMVTSLKLDFENERILICPYCSHMAKATALYKWLQIKAICPACKRPLDIADCPEVLIRKEKK